MKTSVIMDLYVQQGFGHLQLYNMPLTKDFKEFISIEIFLDIVTTFG